jgi:type II secretory pathway pseudopilin PulG
MGARDISASSRRAAGRDGFTLIEALVAFTVLALIMVTLQRLTIGTVAAAVRAATDIESARVAETLLASRALAEGGQAASGRADSRDWSVRFEPVPLAAGAAGGIGARVFRPMRMIVTVQPAGRGDRAYVAEAIRVVPVLEARRP